MTRIAGWNGTRTTEQFIIRAVEIHRDRYDYSKSVYKNCYTALCIICPKHGEFLQDPSNHYGGKGCPSCGKESIIAKAVATFPSEPLAPDQISIILGSLLGDGSIHNPNNKHGNGWFSKTQSLKHKEYIEWTYSALLPYSQSTYEFEQEMNLNVISKGKKFKKIRYNTKTAPIFTELRGKWYPRQKKIVPNDLLLDPLMIAIWFADDGTNNFRRRASRFCTNGFTKKDCNFLRSLLHEQYKICTTLTKRKEIYVLARSHDALIDIIEPFFPWKCFDYKIRRTTIDLMQPRDVYLSSFKHQETGRQPCD